MQMSAWIDPIRAFLSAGHPFGKTKGTNGVETQVLIIGGGATGTGLARDLALRGVHCVVAEKGDINAGASGANHGLLHSGARYVFSDPAVARECRVEAELIKRLAPQCIEDTGGLFVAIEGDDEKYVADFPHFCAQCDIPYREIPLKTVLELEPVLSEKLIAAYLVEDASIDPFKLSLSNIIHAQQLGAILLCHHQVIGLEKGKSRINRVHLLDLTTGKETIVEADQVVNAAGAWGAGVAAMAGLSIDMIYSKGTLLITDHRLTTRVINRLRPPADGDILVPGGTVSILGTTSVRIDSPEQVRPTVTETDLIVDEGRAMLPSLENTRFIRAYAGVRPLISPKQECNDRSVSRGFALLDHATEGLKNFLTIPGGKLTTYRFMAEKTADLVCRRLGISAPCMTKDMCLPSLEGAKWTTPGLAPKVWLTRNDPEDPILCECEMVPRSAIDAAMGLIRDQHGKPDLKTISLRSRMGKGQCQGTFCGFRVTGHLYDRGELEHDQGLNNLKAFLRQRWRGERPVLWNGQLIQAELKEALYCGLCDLNA
jgi:glycerol-3-phosphate dehydrogenase